MKPEYQNLYAEFNIQSIHWQSSLWEDFVEPELWDLEENFEPMMDL